MLGSKADTDNGDGKWKKTAMLGSGAAIGSAGVALLGYSHWATLVPWLPDVAGTTLIAAGIGLAAQAAPKRASRSQGKHGHKHPQWKVDVIPLNDELKFASAIDSVAPLAFASVSLK